MDEEAEYDDERPDIGKTDEEIVRRVLDENDLDAEEALVVLMTTLVDRHLDCEWRKQGRRPIDGNVRDRVDSLNAVMDALYAAKARAAAAQGPPGAIGVEPAPDDAYLYQPVDVRQALMAMILCCQMEARRVCGIDGPEEDEDDDDGGETPTPKPPGGKPTLRLAEY